VCVPPHQTAWRAGVARREAFLASSIEHRGGGPAQCHYGQRITLRQTRLWYSSCSRWYLVQVGERRSSLGDPSRVTVGISSISFENAARAPAASRCTRLARLPISFSVLSEPSIRRPGRRKPVLHCRIFAHASNAEVGSAGPKSEGKAQRAAALRCRDGGFLHVKTIASPPPNARTAAASSTGAIDIVHELAWKKNRRFSRPRGSARPLAILS
jgi:hypothetical protein